MKQELERYKEFAADYQEFRAKLAWRVLELAAIGINLGADVDFCLDPFYVEFSAYTPKGGVVCRIDLVDETLEFERGQRTGSDQVNQLEQVECMIATLQEKAEKQRKRDELRRSAKAKLSSEEIKALGL